MLFVGLDGGGSTCRARVRDGIGTLRATATRGAANAYLDLESAVRTVAATVSDALSAAGAERHEAVRIGLGLAGASGPTVAAAVSTALAGWGETIITHDGDIACLGAHGGADGGLIIAGTGSAAFARVNGSRIAIGGRGFVLGDEGSGARLGLDAMRWALRAHDGLDEHTPLTRRLLARFDDDPVAAIAWGRQAPSSAFAALAPWVFEAAAAGDLAGCTLVQATANAIATLADAIQRRGATRLAFVGGMSTALGRYLPAALRLAFRPPLYDALDGALLLAGCPLPPPASGP